MDRDVYCRSTRFQLMVYGKYILGIGWYQIYYKDVPIV